MSLPASHDVDLNTPIWEERPRPAVVPMPRRGRLIVPGDFLPFVQSVSENAPDS